MAVKWGNTVCTVIKWGSTVCSQVKWGSTVVYPDSSAICFYSYGANPLSFEIGNRFYQGSSQHATYAYISSNTTSDGTITFNTNNIEFTKVTKIYMFSPRNVSVAAIAYPCTKFRLVCNLNTVTGAAISWRIIVAAITGNGYISYIGMIKVDQKTTSASYTGGTYNATVIKPNTDRIDFYIETNVGITGTISEVILYT